MDIIKKILSLFDFILPGIWFALVIFALIISPVCVFAQKNFSEAEILPLEVSSIDSKKNVFHISDPRILVQTIGKKNISNEPYIQNYLKNHDFFSDIKFTKTVNHYSTIFELKEGNIDEENIKRIYFANAKDKNNDEALVFHLLSCNRIKSSCALRINGVTTGYLKKNQEFIIDEKHSIVIRNINFDFCKQKRFCDMLIDPYDIAEIEVKISEGE